ncbi:NUDIX domain-containing protein [Shimia sp.]|jgi:8-oxo-dGTP pyrophosphatase MutT (NUDIX family)|uniref:NUDIX domain-containing protein n=1 Tax=unclassified Shimia TaxID=2630038 RepID=UPI0025F7AC78|nr:NUDIX domain-containing protein [Shimia sp.]MCH2065613.1 NUDIX domain-containing protein [Shimia sp.]
MTFQDSYLGQLRAQVGSRPLIAVGGRVLIEDDKGRFLIIQRADDGLWGLPGGSMELGETLLDVVHREAKEEANATIRDVTVFGLSSDPEIESHTYPNGDQIQSVSLLVHGFLAQKAVMPDQRETVAIDFVAPEEIDMARFVLPERRTFALWWAYQETGQFQLV